LSSRTVYEEMRVMGEKRIVSKKKGSAEKVKKGKKLTHV
jgi:hypothetical protein